MHAVVQRRFGGPEVLETDELPDPVPDREWSVVGLRASALNWHDVLVRQGRYRSPLPHVLGADGAGVDVETGDEVLVLPSLWWGDDESAPGARWEILGDHRPGTYAELVRVPRECVVPKPRDLSWTEAAALPLVGLTTYRALFSRGRLRAGESRPGGRLVVLGASRAERVALDVRPFYFGQFDLLGTTLGSPRDFAGLLRFLDERDVPAPVVDRVFPLDEAAAAHRHLESGGCFGKVILEQSAPTEGPPTEGPPTEGPPTEGPPTEGLPTEGGGR
jgi:NADPH:quinone reductase-like Zn-dependent oxidoreductase